MKRSTARRTKDGTPHWTAGELMTAQPLTIGRKESLITAHRMMSAYRVHHLPVLEQGELVGIVTQRDLYFMETFRDVDLEKDLVEDAMSTDAYAVEPGVSIHAVAQHMACYRFGCTVVLERGKVVGIFTATDALRLLATLTSPARTKRPVTPPPTTRAA
jgi:acetoin utilization protein AcuB